MNLGEYITSYRQEHGLSLRAFAEACDMNHATISLIERGIDTKGQAKNIVENITLGTLTHIANGLRLTVPELINLVDDIPEDIKKAQPKADALSQAKLDFIDAVKQLPDDKVQLLQTFVDALKK